MMARAAELYDSRQPCGAEANAAKFLGAEAHIGPAIAPSARTAVSPATCPWRRRCEAIRCGSPSRSAGNSTTCFIAERVLGLPQPARHDRSRTASSSTRFAMRSRGSRSIACAPQRAVQSDDRGHGCRVREAGGDRSVCAIVLTGAGDRAFCAGGDLSGGTGIFSDGGAQTDLPLADLLRRVRRIEQPIVARVNGACVAGGMALMAMYIAVVAADHAVRAAGSTDRHYLLMQVIAVLQPLPRADLNELTLCADLIPAARARDIGPEPDLPFGRPGRRGRYGAGTGQAGGRNRRRCGRGKYALL